MEEESAAGAGKWMRERNIASNVRNALKYGALPNLKEPGLKVPFYDLYGIYAKIIFEDWLFFFP